MITLKRNIDDWIRLFLGLDQLKKKYGSHLFDDTIFFLIGLEQNRFMILKDKAKILDLLVEFGIDDLSIMRKFLERIKNIYSFESVVKKIREARSKYGLNFIGFNLEELNKNREVVISFSKNGYEKAYFSKDVIPVPQIDFETGEIKYILYSGCEFIMDKKVNQHHERIFYTDDFRFGSMTFPLKEEMDYYDVKKEQKNWMDRIVFALSYFLNKDVELLLKDPDELYDLASSDIYEKYFVLTDGLVLDLNEREIPLKNIFFQQVVVKNADVLLIGRIYRSEVLELKFVIHPNYFKRYVAELKQANETETLSILFTLLNRGIQR